MARPLLAVILGTFTLRLATGITGSMLLFYYADFPSYGGESVSAVRPVELHEVGPGRSGRHEEHGHGDQEPGRHVLPQ